MKTIWRTMILAVLLLSVCLCAQSYAAGSGAYRMEIPDAGVIGKAMAFVGEANAPSAVYYNPAGMTQMKGSHLSMGVAAIQPKADYEDTSGNDTKMKRDTFVIPNGFFVTDMGTEKFALGLGALSSWGLATDWGTGSQLRYNTTRAEMQNKDYLITVAYQVSSAVSFGLGLDIDTSDVEKQKKIAQGVPGVDDANFKLKGSSTGYGFRIATMYKLNDQHQFGLMYRSPIKHKYTGKVHLDGLNDAGAVPYGSIFGGSSYETAVVSKTTLPDSIVLGYSFTPTPKWTFNVDVEWMNWSVVNDEEVGYPGLVEITSGPLAGYRGAVLNDGNPAPRDWRSVFSGAVGMQYAMTERLRLRMGYFHHQTPITNTNWQPNLPDAVSHGLATGFGFDITKNLTFDFAWAGVYYMEREISNDVSTLTGGVNGTYRQWLNLIYATVTYNF